MHAVCESISRKCIIVLDAVRSLLSSYLVIYWWIESIQIEFHASHHNFIWVLVKWRLMIWCTRNTQPHIHTPHHTHDHLYTWAQCTHTHKKKKRKCLFAISTNTFTIHQPYESKSIPRAFFELKMVWHSIECVAVEKKSLASVISYRCRFNFSHFFSSF